MLELLNILYCIVAAIFIITHVIIVVINRREIKEFKRANIFNGIWSTLSLTLSIFSITTQTKGANDWVILVFMILTIINYILLIRDYYPIIKATRNHQDRAFENMEIRLLSMMFIVIFIPLLGEILK